MVPQDRQVLLARQGQRAREPREPRARRDRLVLTAQLGRLVREPQARQAQRESLARRVQQVPTARLDRKAMSAMSVTQV
jgi:hypothetical protein